MEQRKPGVLLIGESPQGFSYLSKRLERKGCACQFAATFEEACRLLEREDFDVVLSPMRLHNRSFYPLIRFLEGGRATLFYSQPVEEGCWWLPALRRGRECFGLAALHPSEFIEALEKILEELRFAAGTPAETPQRAVVRPPGALVTLDSQRREAQPVSAVKETASRRTHKTAS